MFCRVFAIASCEGEEHRAVTVKLADLLAHRMQTQPSSTHRGREARLSAENPDGRV